MKEKYIDNKRDIKSYYMKSIFKKGYLDSMKYRNYR